MESKPNIVNSKQGEHISPDKKYNKPDLNSESNVDENNKIIKSNNLK